MKKVLIVLLLISSVPTMISAQEHVEVDLKKSIVEWEGSVLFGFGGHDGVVGLKEGKLVKDNKDIVGGEFVIDMNTIQSKEEGEWVENLITHLKDPDFFDVKNHSTSKLVMTNVQDLDDGYLRINADLTIKGITQPITFNAKWNDTRTQIDARLKIDRSDWDITYRTQGGDTLKDQIISNAIAFHIHIHL